MLTFVWNNLFWSSQIKHNTLGLHLCSGSLSKCFYMDDLIMDHQTQVLWECWALSFVSSYLGESSTNRLTFLFHTHSHDTINESEQAENKKSRLIFLFPAKWLYVTNLEPDELVPLHRWTQLISHTDSANVWSSSTTLDVQYAPS